MKKTALAACLAAACYSSSSFSAGCSAWWGTSGGYTDTRNPFLMVHGITGFDTIGGLIGYFHTIPMNLCRSGADVKVANVAPFNSSEQRGTKLASDINANVYGSSKFNVFAHSQGSPTTRVAITYAPNRIASLTSVDGVNKGSKVADMIRGIIPVGSGIEGGVAVLANAFGTLVNWLSGNSNTNNSVEALETLTSRGTNTLNASHGYGVASGYCTNDRATQVSVNGNTVRLYSWSGRSVLTNILDPLDGFLVTTSLAFGGEQNDGLVSVCSQKLGYYIGNYDANHVDAIHHVLGVRSLWHDPVTPYRTQANRLKNAGL